MKEIQHDLFDPTKNGEFEIKKLKEIKKREQAKKAKETRMKNKREKELMDLRRFEKEHPESFLFPEYRI